MVEIGPRERELQKRRERERAHCLSETVEQKEERLREWRDRDKVKTLLSVTSRAVDLKQSQGRP